MHDDVANNIEQVRNAISQLERKYHRAAGSVTLLAVSKAQPVEKLQQAYDAGQRHFAENYLQEALVKINALTDLGITWHFIGHVQSNKTKQIATHFSWVHSVASEKIAKRLNEARQDFDAALNVCIEVNLDQEASKTGVSSEQIFSLANTIRQCQKLQLRGLMAIPSRQNNFQEHCARFSQLAKLQQQLIEKGFHCDTLSMGMSSDYEAAIASGSTMVRIGTAIFGERQS